MTKRIIGTLLGIIASAAGIVLWIILGALGYIAGIAGAVMGILFCAVYFAVNREDKSNYPYIMSCVVMLADITLSEIFLWMIAGVSIGDLFTIPELVGYFFIDFGIGAVLSGLVLWFYISSRKRKQKVQEQLQQQQKAAEMEQNTAVFADTEGQNVAQNESGEVKMRKINITRKKKFTGCAVPFRVYCNGKEIASLKNGKSYSFEIPATPHTIQVICTAAVGGPILSNEIITDCNEDELHFEVVMVFFSNTLHLTKV